MSRHHIINSESVTVETLPDGSPGLFVVDDRGNTYEIAIEVSEKCWAAVGKAFIKHAIAHPGVGATKHVKAA